MKQKKVNSYGAKINKYREIQPKKYYIVDLDDPYKPRLIAKYFDSKSQARFCIGKFLKADFRRFDIVTGQEIIDDPIDWFTSTLVGNGERIAKYDYPPELISQQEKKTWRTMYRYHQRRKQNKNK